MRKFFIFLVLSLLLVSCTSLNKTPTPEIQTNTASPTSSYSLSLSLEQGKYFNGSGNCAICHTNMLDTSGVDVSTDKLWRATMLGNSARDPYWLATVRSEINLAPELSDTIQKKCATCHMPMAEFTAVSEGSKPLILDDEFLADEHPLNGLASDGVSCSLCHQVEPANFGQKSSFSGGFQVDVDNIKGKRPAYGPFPTGANLSIVMQGASGFLPSQSLHLEQAGMCGTCHNLYTPYLDENGKIAGEFPEQMIYGEWANSTYRNDNCQICHMPLAQGGVQLSITGGPKRSPFNQHIFVGGNAYMGSVFQQNTEKLQTASTPAQFEIISNYAKSQIEVQTARLSIDAESFKDGQFQAQITIQSKVGHKFPAGFPSRRAWLHIQLLDKDNHVVFESGAFSQDGEIIENDNDQDGSLFEPHYTQITSYDQVQIYEAIMLNTSGAVTTTLLRGASYGKDNRILPSGFDIEHASTDIAFYGIGKDPNFSPGSDSISVNVPVSNTNGPYTVSVDLLYQTIGYRWAANISGQNTTEARFFTEVTSSVPNRPLVAASVRKEIVP